MVKTPLSAGAVSECSKWSDWKDRDDPSGSADHELLDWYITNGGLPADLCSKPTAAQGRIKATRQMVTTQNVVMGLNGLQCINARNDSPCVDYEVRFCCPGNTHSH